MADALITQRCSQRSRDDGVLAAGTAGVGNRFVFTQVEPPWPSRVEDDHRLPDSGGEAGTVTRAIWPVVPGPSP